MEVEQEETRRYGVIDPDPAASRSDPRLHKVRGLVEKPDPADAPSNLAIIGRYVLTPKIFEKLEQTPRGAGGEIQLTDAIQALMAEQDVYAYGFEGKRYDAGHDDGLAEGVGGAGPGAAGHRRGVPALPRGRGPAMTVRPTGRAGSAGHDG